MKWINWKKRLCLSFIIATSLVTVHQDAMAAATVDLGTAQNFAFLAGSGITVAGAVNTTTVTGSIGTYPTTSISGIANIVLSGVNNAGNAVTQTAKSDLLTAYNSAVGRPADVSYGPGHDLGGQTLVAGVYNSSSTLGLTGSVTLDAQGDPSAVWILQAGSSLTTASNSSVVLTNGAQACNVFWVIGSSATLGTGTNFVGNILALTSITLTTSVTVDGRVLAINGAVVLDTNTLMLPTCSVVINPGTTVINNPLTVSTINLSPASTLVITSNLVVQSGIFNVPNGVSFINGGTVNVPGDFNKDGVGTLVANTVVQVAGNAFINQGALLVNGTLQANQVNVMPLGLLGGTGLIIGNVTNAGIVAPSNGFSIQGNFTQTNSGTLIISNGTVLSGTGQVNLAGTLDARGLSATHMNFGDQVLMLTSGSIHGNFGTIDMPNSDTLRGRFLTGGGSGSLLVAPTSYALVAQTQNQNNVAHALDQWISIDTGDIGSVTLALDLLTAKQYPVAFEAMMPSVFASAMNTSVELSQNQGQLLFQQFSARHLGARLQSSSATMPNEAPMLTSAKGVMPNVAPAVVGNGYLGDGERWTSWVQGSGMFSQGGLNLAGDENFESGTFLVGTDYALNEHFAVGLFAGYQEGWSDYANGSSMNLRSVRFGAYATMNWEGFYASAAVGGGFTDYSMTRQIQWATLSRTAHSDPQGSDFFTMFGTGYDFRAGNFIFGPSASVQYTRLNLNSFTERGAGVLDLRVADAQAQSLRTYLGGRVAYTMKINDHLTLIPELRLFWSHEFMQDGTMNAALNGGNGASFAYAVSTPERDALFASVGLGMLWGDRFTTSLYYNASLGRRDANQHSITLMAQWRF